MPVTMNSDLDPISEMLSHVLHPISRALQQLGNGDASTPMGALEAHGMTLREGIDGLQRSVGDVADAIRYLADAVRVHPE